MKFHLIWSAIVLASICVMTYLPSTVIYMYVLYMAFFLLVSFFTSMGIFTVMYMTALEKKIKLQETAEKFRELNTKWGFAEFCIGVLASIVLLLNFYIIQGFTILPIMALTIILYNFCGTVLSILTIKKMEKNNDTN